MDQKGDIVKPPKGGEKTDQEPPARSPLVRIEARVTTGRIDKERTVSRGNGNCGPGRELRRYEENPPPEATQSYRRSRTLEDGLDRGEDAR